MDCTNLHTAAEVLEAFRACNDVGEEIELFECLATRPEPPLEAFAEILKNIHLEPVLALTIQAFGKITNTDIKARLKQSDDLLEMLSRKAQSGSTDLIRWAAATAIEEVGFDFIAVSRYLSQEPKKIAAKINELKIKRFADPNLLNSSDYDEFIHFWAYGPAYVLREDAVKVQRQNAYRTILDVINTQKLRGIKKVRDNLHAAETLSARRESVEPGVSYAGLMDEMIESAENELFEEAGQYLSARWLSQLNPIIESKRNLAFELFMEVQLHCLQSNNSKIRQQAANTIIDISKDVSSLGFNFFDKLEQEKPVLAIAVSTFSLDYGSTKYIYIKLEEMRENLILLTQELARIKVRQDCQDWLDRILQELDVRKKRFETRRQQSINLHSKIDERLKKIRAINSELYEQVFTKVCFDRPPQLSVENENYIEVLNIYEQALRDSLANLRKAVVDFYKLPKEAIEVQLSEISLDISIAREQMSHSKKWEDLLFDSDPFYNLLLIIALFLFLNQIIHISFWISIIMSVMVGWTMPIYIWGIFNKKTEALKKKLDLKLQERSNKRQELTSPFKSQEKSVLDLLQL